MTKVFNVNADCKPQLHYMVDLSSRLAQIKAMVDAGKYFAVSQARQYGKTTILKALETYLESDYIVISLDFQMFSYADFQTEGTFAAAFSAEVLDALEDSLVMPEEVKNVLKAFAGGNVKEATLSKLFRCLNQWCRSSEKGIVLMIDEADSVTNNQVFLDFLALLRGYYINRDKRKTFQSVILASVYDIKNMKRRFADENGHKINSPWNIAADFLVDLRFSVSDIKGMLSDYESSRAAGMDTGEMAELIYTYTDGYPFLVSRLCKLMDEQIAEEQKRMQHAVWTKEGFLEAVRIVLKEKNSLFDSMYEKLTAYPELKEMIETMLFQGQRIVYNPDNDAVGMALMFGFVKTDGCFVAIANRIFETRLYNLFLTTPQVQKSGMYKEAVQTRNQFVENGHLNMRLVLEKFVRHFNDLYGSRNQKFLEKDGRRYFLLFLLPIINGTGNYYIESETRSQERTDVIIDYNGEQMIIELKIWRGSAYHAKGRQQLSDYLNAYHLDKGYMISFNFNEHKECGVREISFDGKVIVEAVV